MAHDHTHDIDVHSGDRRVALAIVANHALTFAQLVGGILAGSLALIADALHNFSDVASLVFAFGARKIARRPGNGPRRPRLTRSSMRVRWPIQSIPGAQCQCHQSTIACRGIMNTMQDLVPSEFPCDLLVQ